MPELPEVETIRRSLLPKLVDQIITGVEVRNRQLRYPVSTRRLRRYACGRRVVDLGRRAKYLKIILEDEYCLLIHLGMSGRLLLKSKKAPLD